MAISSFDYIYQYKDHLGNIRLSYSDKNNDGNIDVIPGSAASEILEENNYYPFGLKHKGYNSLVTDSNKALDFKYNGIELEESLGFKLYEMPLRQYDPTIARWTGIDPVTHHSTSTYNAFDNNPVYWADPSGADAWTYLGDGTYKNNRTSEVTDDWQRAVSETDGSEQNKSDSNEECCGGKSAAGAYKHVESRAERLFYDQNPGIRKIVREAAFEAGVLASRVDIKKFKNVRLGGDNNGYSGAIRHSYWMYLLAIELGPDLAENIGILHENFRVDIGRDKGKHNFRTLDGEMDLINNAWGVNLARQNPNLDYIEFEERFFKDVTRKNNTTIRIINIKTIPKETLRSKREREHRKFIRFGEF